MALTKSNIYLLITVFVICASVYHLMPSKRSEVTASKQTPIASKNSSEIIEDFVIEPIFREKELVIWTNDYHFAPVIDLKNLLKPLGVRIIDRNVYPHFPACELFPESCEGRKTLKVMDKKKVFRLEERFKSEFYDVYKDDPEMKTVDAFVCFHPSSLCELFEPFNKSLIIVASTRYELGRFMKDRWRAWNENLIRYASHPRNVIGANNLYDAEYIKYFTGLQPQYLPSFGNYTNVTYSPTRPGFLLAFTRSADFSEIFFHEHGKACKAVNCKVELTSVSAKYGQYKYSDLAAHMGIVYLPYQVSVMSVFEQYRMDVPMFFPSKELLVKWQHEQMIMFERTWAGVRGNKPNGSNIAAHPSQSSVPDPNNESDEAAIRYWVKFCDFYQWPHITYYDSIPHLVEILEKMTSSKLKEISDLMKSYSIRAKKEILGKWKINLLEIAKHSVNKPH